MPASHRPCSRQRGVAVVAAWSLLAFAARPAARAEAEPVMLEPWRVEEVRVPAVETGRGDAFAARLGPSAVVGSANWSERPVATLAEVLRELPGVATQESFGGFEPPRISIRGSGLDSAPTSRGVTLLVDGLPLARADGAFHLGLLDPQLFARLEMNRGGLHAGSSPLAAGGVLQAVTRGAAVNSATARMEVGAGEARRGQVMWSAGDNDGALSVARAGGWRAHSAQARVAGRAGWERTWSATTVRASVYVARAEYEVPGPLTWAEAWSQPRAASAAALRDDPRRDSTLGRGSVQVKRRATGDGDEFEAGLAVQRLADDFRQLQGNGETEAVSDDVSIHAGWTRTRAIGEREHHFVVRTSAAAGENRVDRALNLGGVRGGWFGTYAARSGTWTGSVEDMIRWTGRTTLGFGLTALHARRELVEGGLTRGTGLGRAMSFRTLLPRAAMTWRAGPAVDVQAGYSETAEPPTGDELVSVAGTFPTLSLRSRELRGQRARTMELGIAGARGPLSWTVTAYRATWRDEILRLADAAGLPRGAVNAGPTCHQGLETAVRWRLWQEPVRVTAALTSTLGRFWFEDDPVYGRNRLAGAPPHVGRAELRAEGRSGFCAVENTWAAGRTWVDHAGRLGYGGHALVHVRAGWRWGGGGGVFVAAKNVFDRAHIASAAGVLDVARAPVATAIFLPGAGRVLTAGVEWRWR